jgi:hypothetical protein
MVASWVELLGDKMEAWMAEKTVGVRAFEMADR